MKAWMIGLSVASVLFTLAGCGDDDSPPDGVAGEGGAGGEPSGVGGSSAGSTASDAGSTGNEGGAACEPPAAPSTDEEPAIAGSYEDSFGSSHTVGTATWSMGSSLFHITAFDNEERWIVAQNDASNGFNACAWSRFDWVTSGDALYYCQTAYDAPSEEAAKATAAADGSDPATTGCGAFPWSELIAQ